MTIKLKNGSTIKLNNKRDKSNEFKSSNDALCLIAYGAFEFMDNKIIKAIA